MKKKAIYFLGLSIVLVSIAILLNGDFDLKKIGLTFLMWSLFAWNYFSLLDVEKSTIAFVYIPAGDDYLRHWVMRIHKVFLLGLPVLILFAKYL